jgi:hypothetical protein
MSSSNAWKAVLASVMLATLGLITSCTRPSEPSSAEAPPTAGDPPPIFANWPPEADDFRFHWSASRGMDVEIGPAVAVRAYVESYRLAELTGGDLAVTYPGFLRATPENADVTEHPEIPLQQAKIRPGPRTQPETAGIASSERQFFGYQPSHILGLYMIPGGVRATVCLGRYPIYQRATGKPDKFVSIMADPATGEPQYMGSGKFLASGVEIWRIELTDEGPTVGQNPGTPATAQEGPLPAPVDDVFGRWFITGSSAGTGVWGALGDSEWIDDSGVRAECEAAMPEDAATREAMATGFHDSPPPHSDPVPGWPARVS